MISGNLLLYFYIFWGGIELFKKILVYESSVGILIFCLEKVHNLWCVCVHSAAFFQGKFK